MRALIAACTVSLCLAQPTGNALALTMRFNDGTQLDADPINDIAVALGDNISFANRWTDQGALDNFDGFQYIINFDNLELLYLPQATRLDTQNHVPGGVGESAILINNTQILVTHLNNGSNFATPNPGIIPGFTWRGDEFTFKVLNLKNDGNSDYSLEGIQLFVGNNANAWPVPQIVEKVDVQGVPAPLPIVGFGPLMLYVRRLRAKSRILKSRAISNMG
jgi:hypothetical protein